MDKEGVIMTPAFDPDYWKVGRAYKIKDANGCYYTALLKTYELNMLTFIYVDDEEETAEFILEAEDIVDCKFSKYISQ